MTAAVIPWHHGRPHDDDDDDDDGSGGDGGGSSSSGGGGGSSSSSSSSDDDDYTSIMPGAPGRPGEDNERWVRAAGCRIDHAGRLRPPRIRVRPHSDTLPAVRCGHSPSCAGSHPAARAVLPARAPIFQEEPGRWPVNGVRVLLCVDMGAAKSYRHLTFGNRALPAVLIMRVSTGIYLDKRDGVRKFLLVFVWYSMHAC